MTPMHKEWIDNASYEDLLRKWRFEPSGSPWFSGDTGEYFAAAMKKKTSEMTDKQKTSASKQIGWDV